MKYTLLGVIGLSGSKKTTLLEKLLPLLLETGLRVNVIIRAASRSERV